MGRRNAMKGNEHQPSVSLRQVTFINPSFDWVMVELKVMTVDVDGGGWEWRW